jgi:hypothetical protein
LDNPGWTIKIDLAGTPLQDRSFKEINTERSELNWLQCQVKDARFEGFGGPENLSEILGLFLDWSDTETTQAPDNKEGQDNSSAVRQ